MNTARTRAAVVGDTESQSGLSAQRKGRGGCRPGAGRKPSHLKQLALPPIGAAEIVARRHPQSERLSPEELAMLHTLTKKLAEPSPDGRRNQKESNRATFEASTATNKYGSIVREARR
jgi:hypothetical protein